MGSSLLGWTEGTEDTDAKWGGLEIDPPFDASSNARDALDVLLVGQEALELVGLSMSSEGTRGFAASVEKSGGAVAVRDGATDGEVDGSRGASWRGPVCFSGINYLHVRIHVVT